MAEVPVTSISWEYLSPIDIKDTALTAFTADGIKWSCNGKNTVILSNTGAGPNTVTVTAYQTTTEGFPISDKDFVLAAGDLILTGKIGNVIAGNQVIMNVTGTPAEVKYKVLSFLK
jgi:hypothetical protein